MAYVTYRVCLNCGNRKGLYWKGAFLWCPMCGRPDGSEIQ